MSSKTVHIRLELDTEEIFKAFMTIKKHKGIRSNTDVLRNLIFEEYRRITANKHPTDS